jgi:hypothetical protein
MVDGVDKAADAFRSALNSTDKVQPRDESGRFAESRPRPESLFAERQTEGDEFGDTRDGGEDARMRRQEERANGDPFENAVSDDRRQPRTKKPVRASGDEEHEFDDEEQTGAGDGQDESAEVDEPPEGDGAEGDAEPDAEGEERYEVTVDGQPKEVSLKEALDGYIRTETFNQRMSQVGIASQQVSQEAQNVARMRDNYINQTAILEQEIMTLLPKEPDWDAEYSKDPKAAYELRKQYDAIAGKLTELRRSREAAANERQQEVARNTENYAKEQFAQFVMEEKIPDEGALKKEISSMRRTAIAAGFAEHEVASVYDKRMLKILRKASRYDRLMATRPKAVIPGKGKTLTPGNAPRVGNSGRKSIDEAQRRLANTGRLDDAASVFERILR